MKEEKEIFRSKKSKLIEISLENIVILSDYPISKATTGTDYISRLLYLIKIFYQMRNLGTLKQIWVIFLLKLGFTR